MRGRTSITYHRTKRNRRQRRVHWLLKENLVTDFGRRGKQLALVVCPGKQHSSGQLWHCSEATVGHHVLVPVAKHPNKLGNHPTAFEASSRKRSFPCLLMSAFIYQRGCLNNYIYLEGSRQETSSEKKSAQKRHGGPSKKRDK